VEIAVALLTIAAMLTLGALSFLLLMRMLRTIRDLRGITTGLHDTMRWAVGQVAAQPPAHGRGREETSNSS
jgi:hypothetical protein